MFLVLVVVGRIRKASVVIVCLYEKNRKIGSNNTNSSSSRTAIILV